MFWRSLFVRLSFFFWPLHYMSFFDLRPLITTLVSSNFSILSFVLKKLVKAKIGMISALFGISLVGYIAPLWVQIVKYRDKILICRPFFMDMIKTISVLLNLAFLNKYALRYMYPFQILSNHCLFMPFGLLPPQRHLNDLTVQ